MEITPFNLFFYRSNGGSEFSCFYFLGSPFRNGVAGDWKYLCFWGRGIRFSNAGGKAPRICASDLFFFFLFILFCGCATWNHLSAFNQAHFEFVGQFPCSLGFNTYIHFYFNQLQFYTNFANCFGGTYSL